MSEGIPAERTGLICSRITLGEIEMNLFEKGRRSFLVGVGGLGMSNVLGSVRTEGAAAQAGQVVGANEGEHLIHFRDHGNIFIKFGSATGSENLAMGTQQVMAGGGIPVHRHLHMDEAFYILEGKGTVSPNDVSHSFQKGATVFIPRNTWHGFANPEEDLLLLWITAPAGLDGFFRETCSPPGVPTKQFTREQIKEIALKYGTEFR